MPSDFYNKVYQACHFFLGDNTKRFLDRQIEVHLSKSPDTVNYNDKEELARWIRISAGLLLSKEDSDTLYEKVISFEK